MNTSNRSPLIAISKVETEERSSLFQVYDDDLKDDSQEWKDTKARLESYLPRYRTLWLAYHQEKNNFGNDNLMEENFEDSYEADDEMVICCDKQKCTCGILSFVPREFLEIEIKNQSQDNQEVLSDPEWENDNNNDESVEKSSSDETESSGGSTCVAFDVSWLPSPTGSKTMKNYDVKNNNVPPQQLPLSYTMDVLEILDSSLSDDDDDKENDYSHNRLTVHREPEIIVIDSDDDIASISNTSKHASKSNIQGDFMMPVQRDRSPIKNEGRMVAKTGTTRRRRLVFESSDEELAQSESEGENLVDSDDEGNADTRNDQASERHVLDLLGRIKALSLRNESEKGGETFRTAKRNKSGVSIDLVDSDDESEHDESMDATYGKENIREIAAGKVPPNKKKTTKRRNSFIVDSEEDVYSEESDEFSYSDVIGSPVEERHEKYCKPRGSDKISNAAFRRAREQMSQAFFAEFDKKVFDGKLAENTKVVWSNKLRTTAGLTRLKALRRGKEIISRSAVVELSTKVLEDSQRLRATLMHELCHAAQWLEDGVSKPPHGEVFKKWAKRATRRMPDIPVTVKHDYEISFKYTWKCVQCNGMLKRHSRSVNVEKHVCGRCNGRLVEVEADGTEKSSTAKSARLPSAYNQFIKDNSYNVRRELEKSQFEKVTQAQVLKECARQWKEKSSN